MRFTITPEQVRQSTEKLLSKEKDHIASMAVRLGALALDEVPKDFVAIAYKGPGNHIIIYNREKKATKVFSPGYFNKAIQFLSAKPKEKLIYFERKIYGKRHG